ncbi:MAG: CaiB/BaiF CoA transferase family protein [Candidatus Hodarchaeales archaeon]|jgi:crotonobetainyl-CoA:carnitine CoA-transferase CaiB-like acyl-CoA transferase
MPLRLSLKGTQILDLTSNLPGPMASQILGDFGADIIKVESLDGDPVRRYPPFIETESVVFLLLNRNKRSIAVNLKTEKGRDIFYELVKRSDVVLEGFRPGVSKRLKIDFDTLKVLKQDIIYCSLTGYGDSDVRSGHDLNYVASSGITYLTGPKELPTPIGVPIADIGGGSLPAVIAILAALLQRKEKAQKLSIQMTEQMIPWLSVAVSTYIAGLGKINREEHVLSGYNAYYRLYRTNDNRYVSFAPLETKFWNNFCVAIKREDLIGKQFDSDICDAELPKIFIQKSQKEWNEWFSKYDVPGAPVFSPEEALKVNNRLQTINHPNLGEISVIPSPYLNKNIESCMRPPPLLSQHSREILEEIGYLNEFERLREQGIIC